MLPGRFDRFELGNAAVLMHEYNRRAVGTPSGRPEVIRVS